MKTLLTFCLGNLFPIFCGTFSKRHYKLIGWNSSILFKFKYKQNKKKFRKKDASSCTFIFEFSNIAPE